MIQRIRSKIAWCLAMALTILTFGRIQLDWTGEGEGVQAAPPDGTAQEDAPE